MALIPTRPTVEPRGRITFRPKESNIEIFRAYAEMSEATEDPDYVFDLLVEKVLAADPEFVTFRRTHPDAGKIKKPGRKVAADRELPKPDAGKQRSNGADKSLTNPLRVGASA